MTNVNTTEAARIRVLDSRCRENKIEHTAKGDIEWFYGRFLGIHVFNKHSECLTSDYR